MINNEILTNYSRDSEIFSQITTDVSHNPFGLLISSAMNPGVDQSGLSADVPVLGSDLILGSQSLVSYVNGLSDEQARDLTPANRAELVRRLAEDGWGKELVEGASWYVTELDMIKKLYSSWKPSGAFLAETESIVDDVALYLSSNYDLSDVKKNWKSLPALEKEKFLEGFLQQQFSIMKLDAFPKIQFTHFDSSKSQFIPNGTYDHESNTVSINLHPNDLNSNSFVKAVSTAFHEGMHSYQAQLIDKAAKGEFNSVSPIWGDVLMLWVNGQDNASIDATRWGDGYQQNPQEAQAWSATDWLRESMGADKSGLYTWSCSSK